MDAATTLIRYMNAMREWELECGRFQEACNRGEIPFKQVVAAGMKQYEAIYDAFISKRHKQPRDFHFSIPPDYDPKNETIVASRPMAHNYVEIETTQKQGFQDRYVYTLVRNEGNWLLCEKELVTSSGERIRANL
jgi:hypothetical protein